MDIGKLPVSININVRPVTPPEAGLAINGVKTPANTQQIYELLEPIKSIDPRVEKLGKAAPHASVLSNTQKSVNEQIMKANQRNERRKGNKQVAYVKARVMSCEVVKRRQLAKKQQEKEDALKYQQKEEAKKQKALGKIQLAKMKEEAKAYKLVAQARERELEKGVRRRRLQQSNLFVIHSSFQCLPHPYHGKYLEYQQLYLTEHIYQTHQRGQNRQSLCESYRVFQWPHMEVESLGSHSDCLTRHYT